jgi:two-component system, cell cycle sensor histidine kinase and response regulator CckA
VTDTLRVLMAEDSPTDAKLVVQALRAMGLEVDFERVEDPESMRRALEERTWDFVLSDWSMPKFSAMGALDVLKKTGKDLPFIIVSGTVGEESAVDAMHAGAHDYVLKDKLGRLGPAIERELRECKARGALREAQARFSRLSESGIIGINIADIHGNILEANDAYLKMVGYSREELVRGAVRWAALTPPEFRHLAAEAEVQLRATGIAPPWETETFRKDGSRVSMLVGVAMLEYPRCIAFTADITERKQAEAGRARAEKALHQSEEQLRQAQKMEAVGRLAGGVAHDFNNVLSVIMTYGELILGDLKPADPLRTDIEEICKAAARAAGLTRQLLLFSRQQVVEPKVMDLNEVLTSMDKMLQRILGEDVSLVSLTTKSSGRVKVDPSHIEQVILNLVVNARDAMPTGGKLTIETTSVVLDEGYAMNHLPAKAGPHVMLAVSDTGTGMDRETQKRIFEPFFTTKGTGKGTGLGLSTVFGIVQQSGGHIWVYSEPGKGTTFKIYLPRVDAKLDVLNPSVTPTTLRGTETVLLVEDEEQVRTVVLAVLRRQGYHVIPAQNGGEALLLCEKHPGAIDLLLTDVVMPSMSGPELARRLAATRPEMRVLCMSGYTDDSIVRHGVLESGVAFIQKPITPASLTAKVREVLDAGRAPSSAARA